MEYEFDTSKFTVGDMLLITEMGQLQKEGVGFGVDHVTRMYDMIDRLLVSPPFRTVPVDNMEQVIGAMIVALTDYFRLHNGPWESWRHDND